MYQRILSDPLNFPPDMPSEARSVMTGLLQRDPARRLGANGGEEIKRHPFFAKYIDWNRYDILMAVIRRVRWSWSCDQPPCEEDSATIQTERCTWTVDNLLLETLTNCFFSRNPSSMSRTLTLISPMRKHRTRLSLILLCRRRCKTNSGGSRTIRRMNTWAKVSAILPCNLEGKHENVLRNLFSGPGPSFVPLAGNFDVIWFVVRPFGRFIFISICKWTFVAILIYVRES